MNTNSILTMRCLIIFAFFLFLKEDSKGQGFNYLQIVEKELKGQKNSKDSLNYFLIDIIENKSNNDSLRVSAVHVLASLRSDTGIIFLLSHLTYTFNYGDGISDLDQENYLACWSALMNTSGGYDYRWRLFSNCIYILQTINQDKVSIKYLLSIMLKSTSKESLKSILKDELRKNSLLYQDRNQLYEKNLNNLLSNME